MAKTPSYDTSRYTVTPDKGRFPGAPKLEPRGAGLYDIVKDYSWTLSPKGSDVRSEVPYILLTEKALDLAAIISHGAYWLYFFKNDAGVGALANTVAGGIGAGAVANIATPNPYKYLYPAKPTNFHYKLPYFSDHNREIRNDWDSSDIDLFHPIVRGVETLAKAIFVGVGHEIPRAYTAGSLESITVNFVLLNTTSFEDVQQNYDFCYAFSYQNLQNRRNAALVDPPVFYSYKIPGVKYSDAAVVTNLSITNLGQTKVISGFSDGKPKIIPEAYNVSITFTDLISQSRNFMNAMQTDNLNLVTSSETPQTGIKSIDNTIGGGGG